MASKLKLRGCGVHVLAQIPHAADFLLVDGHFDAAAAFLNIFRNDGSSQIRNIVDAAQPEIAVGAEDEILLFRGFATKFREWLGSGLRLNGFDRWNRCRRILSLTPLEFQFLDFRLKFCQTPEKKLIFIGLRRPVLLKIVS